MGAAATVIHLVVMTGLLRSQALGIMTANALAFSVAFAVSFAGHYYWTFERPGAPLRAFGRALLSSVVVLAVNSAVLLALINGLALEPIHAGAMAALLVPVIAYVINRLWAFSARA